MLMRAWPPLWTCVWYDPLETRVHASRSHKPRLHPRNRHRGRYDFARLCADVPELRRFLHVHPLAGETLDFADPDAVTTLNRALLKTHYDIPTWSLPAGYLCPPIPSRVDYLHHMADLLADGGELRRGPAVRVLDVGTGANGIYPLLGVKEYDWSFVATDIDAVAVENVRSLVKANAALDDRVEVRLQTRRECIFEGVVQPGETFALSLCNPPFHASAEDARAGTKRKLKNLGRGKLPITPVLNFGGQANELWCDGGEVGFVGRMIAESARRPELCDWFTSLVARSENLPALERLLSKAQPADVRIIATAAGQKQSRILAWSFMTKDARLRTNPSRV